MKGPIAIQRVIIALSICLLPGATPAARAGVEPFPVSLLPAFTLTDVDSVVTLDLFVDAPAAQFNAYEVTLQFDPDVLEATGVGPGPLMFPPGCGPPFPLASSTDSTVTYFITLLCAGVSLDGPGVVGRFSFRALADGISPIDIVSDPDHSFYDGGLDINPTHPTYPRQVTFTNAVIAVGPDPTDGPVTPAAPPGALRIRPNPARGGTELFFDLRGAGETRLEIVDVTGRRVFARQWSAATEGPHREAWSGRDGAGQPLPAGLYFVRLRDGRGVRSGKLTLVR